MRGCRHRGQPVATRVEKSFPLILVERDTAVSYYTKDSASTVETEATVFVVTEDYNSGKTIAEAVINALDRKEATYTGFAVLDCTHIGAVEGYQDQSFVQQIQFHFITSIK